MSSHFARRDRDAKQTTDTHLSSSLSCLGINSNHGHVVFSLHPSSGVFPFLGAVWGASSDPTRAAHPGLLALGLTQSVTQSPADREWLQTASVERGALKTEVPPHLK